MTTLLLKLLPYKLMSLILAQGIEALAALSYVLRIDGQDAVAEKFDLMNKRISLNTGCKMPL